MTRDEEWLLKEKYDGEKTEGFFIDCEMVKRGEPLAYVIGWIPFLNTKILLDSKPLIPRIETEFWVEKAINDIEQSSLGRASVRVLDLCAGSGCIGVAVLNAVPEAYIDFAELDESHHDTIIKNVRENNINEARVHIIGGDLSENVREKYDFILTNPPYIDASLERVSEDVKEHEPSLALYGGTHGMDIIKRIISAATQFLTEEGVLYIEHEPEQAEAIGAHAKPLGFACAQHNDQFGVIRYTRLSRSN